MFQKQAGETYSWAKSFRPAKTRHTHKYILEENKFTTLNVCQANNQIDDLHPYDRIKLPVLKKCFAILRLDMAVAIC